MSRTAVLAMFAERVAEADAAVRPRIIQDITRYALWHGHLKGMAATEHGYDHLDDPAEDMEQARIWIDIHLRHIARRHARAWFLESRDLRVPPSDRLLQDRKWTVLVHPLHLMETELAAAMTPGFTTDVTADRKVEHDLLIGDLAIRRVGDPARIRVRSDALGVRLHLAAVPSTVVQDLAGRPLSDLVRIPETGIPERDAIVADLRIADAQTDGIETEIRLDPSPWVPLGDAPTWIAREWEEHMRRHPCLI